MELTNEELLNEELLSILNGFLHKHGNVPLDILINRIEIEELKSKGKYFPCPKCDMGLVYIKKVYSFKDETERMVKLGSINREYYSIETKPCDICSGKGYTETELKIIIKE